MTEPYEVKIVGAVKRQLRRISKNNQKRILEKIEELVFNPRPYGYAKLESSDELYRVRIGDYRIIYQINDKILLVIVLEIGHRREIYR
ncbi:MAG: type II toxin-antitoxin system RelE/ParE family toxin [Pyrinomonadaceae bacterium]|nr:type II toxin-antitoxin system RelE/ParE family toxin [Pyrinomonadaceae bacterium]